MSGELGNVSVWVVPVSSFVGLVCNWAGLAYCNRGYCTYQVSTFFWMKPLGSCFPETFSGFPSYLG